MVGILKTGINELDGMWASMPLKSAQDFLYIGDNIHRLVGRYKENDQFKVPTLANNWEKFEWYELIARIRPDNQGRS